MNILGLFAPATKLIDEIFTSDEERLELRNELERIKADVNNHMLDLGGKVVEAEAQIKSADFKLREQELKSDSWLVRSWRPMMTILLGMPMLWNFIAVPFITLFTSRYALMEPLALTPEYWAITQTFYGVYGGGRTLEKVVKHLRK